MRCVSQVIVHVDWESNGIGNIVAIFASSITETKIKVSGFQTGESISSIETCFLSTMANFGQHAIDLKQMYLWMGF